MISKHKVNLYLQSFINNIEKNGLLSDTLFVFTYGSTTLNVDFIPNINIGITAMNEALTSQLVNIPSINSERNSVANRAIPPAIGVGKACCLWGFVPGISSSL